MERPGVLTAVDSDGQRWRRLKLLGEIQFAQQRRADDGKDRKEALVVRGKSLRVQGVLGEHEVD